MGISSPRGQSLSTSVGYQRKGCSPEYMCEEYRSGIYRGAGGLWPNGEIYYEYIPNKEIGMQQLIESAITEWNRVNSKVCRYINRNMKPPEFKGFVKIRETEKGIGPRSHVGYWSGGGKEICIPKYYPDDSEVRIECILHEMMHTAGFSHEHCRPDRKDHVTIDPPKKKENESKSQKELEEKRWEANFGISTNQMIGGYDYLSLMHYGHNAGLKAKNSELTMYADKSKSFSEGDIRAIKILYGPKGTHHGDWVTRNQLDYWDCCLSTRFEDSKCLSEHTGVWHEKCALMGRGCNEELCACGNCGRGCAYTGSEAHWTCCRETTRDLTCWNKFKKVVT